MVTTTITGTANNDNGHLDDIGPRWNSDDNSDFNIQHGSRSTALYGVAAVAVIFIIVSGYLAVRGRKPAS